MKRRTLLLAGLTALSAAAFGAGCASAFTHKAQQTDWPVANGFATSNDNQVQEWIRVPAAYAHALAPSPYDKLADAAAGALIALAGAAGGWIGRHQADTRRTTPTNPPDT